MADILLKGVPEELHRKLKQEASRHRRSMNQEALVLLEQALSGSIRQLEFPPAIKGRFPLTKAFVDRAKREGRA